MSKSIPNGTVTFDVEEICLTYGNRPDALIEILYDIQTKFGHVPESTLPVIAEALNLSRAEVYGVVTFYHDFHLKPKGKHVIKICRAEACQSAGGFEVIAALEKVLNIKLGETTKDGRITLEAVYCLGLCPMGPAALIDERPRAAIKAHKVEALVKELV
ncbi:MAG: NAD(P)H-dependent oxidoreductase subunit E [Pseudomonadota bacterium]|nr:NAD(P)H-dependent oxidoreductase subunit E [Pseudomonadota bacterium]